jgi:hypothetical protein
MLSLNFRLALKSVKLLFAAAFVQGFESSEFVKFPRLKLQNLTSNNIKLYVEDKLKKDDMMLPLLVKEPHNATQLFKNIVD